MSICIKNGFIVDGTGKKPFYGDILIDGDIISKIGADIDTAKTDCVIDASGLTVMPGIIDGHTHAEIDVLRNPQQPHAVYQGITTFITGQCGLGFAPMHPEQLEDSIRINSGIFGDWRKYSECWKTFDSMLDSLDRAAVNVGANISHNAIRQYDSRQVLPGSLWVCLIIRAAIATPRNWWNCAALYKKKGECSVQALIHRWDADSKREKRSLQAL